MSLQLLVILVPVLFAFMGFAFDLGRIYLIKGELSQAAASMALASAQRLIGTTDSTEKAITAASQLLDDSTGHGARYSFGALPIGQTTGLLTSEVGTPAFYATYSAVMSGGSADQADGTTARHAQVALRADAPLLFWGLLSAGASRSTPIAVQASAGLSAPVCTACNIEPIAVAALSTEDTQDFGFGVGTRYTFAYTCQPAGTSGTRAQPLTGTSTVIDYLLIDRYDEANANLDESQQLYRIGAQGLLPNVAAARACVQIGGAEVLWGTNGGTMATPTSCTAGVPAVVQNVLCGFYSRFQSDLPTACQTAVTDIDSLYTIYQPDPDITDLDDYTAYTGNARRVITIPIVDLLDATTTMNVLGFRQFLLEPEQNSDPAANNPADRNGRFVVLYLGTNTADNLTTPVPLKQGMLRCLDGTAQTITAGPGKVVLHQ